MSKIAKTTLLVMVLTIFSKLLGLFREQILAATYGMGMQTDIYVTAMKIPTILFSAIGGAIATSLVPVYSKIKENKGEQESKKFINNLINIVILITLFIVLLGNIFTEELVKIFAIGFEGQKLELTVKFVKIILWALIFMGNSRALRTYLQLNGNFKTPGLVGIPYNVIIIASIIISVKTNFYILIIGSLIGLISQVLFQLAAVRITGFNYNLKVDFKDENVKYLIILVLPVLIGGGVEQINTLIDGTIASTFGEGIVTSFNYANRLYGFVSSIFVVSILSVVYPIMAKTSAAEDTKAFKISIKKTLNIILMLIIPICVGTLVLSEPIVKLLFERGKFSQSDTIMTANILMIYIISILAFSLRNVISRAFYSLHDTKTPMINGAIAIVFNIVLNIVLSKYMGYIGLAIATTIAAYIGLVIFLITLRKRIGSFDGKSILTTAVKSIIAAVIMGIVTSICYNQLATVLGIGLIGQVIKLGLSILLGASVYAIVIFILKVEETQIVLDMIKKKIK